MKLSKFYCMACRDEIYSARRFIMIGKCSTCEALEVLQLMFENDFELNPKGKVYVHT